MNAITERIPKAKHPLWWCFVVSGALNIYFLASPWLSVRTSLNLALYGFVWIFTTTTGVIPLRLPFTEWVETQYLYIITYIKHRLYGPDPSTSGLLLLPPELRLRIWEELDPKNQVCSRRNIPSLLAAQECCGKTCVTSLFHPNTRPQYLTESHMRFCEHADKITWSVNLIASFVRQLHT